MTSHWFCSNWEGAASLWMRACPHLALASPDTGLVR